MRHLPSSLLYHGGGIDRMSAPGRLLHEVPPRRVYRKNRPLCFAFVLLFLGTYVVAWVKARAGLVAHLKVQVGSGAVPGAAYTRDYLTLGDLVAFFH